MFISLTDFSPAVEAFPDLSSNFAESSVIITNRVKNTKKDPSRNKIEISLNRIKDYLLQSTDEVDTNLC